MMGLVHLGGPSLRKKHDSKVSPSLGVLSSFRRDHIQRSWNSQATAFAQAHKTLQSMQEAVPLIV